MELLVEHFPTPGGFAEAAGTELCKENVAEIADIELDCTGTYPLAMRNNSRLSLTVKCINDFGLTNVLYAAIHDLVARAMFLEAVVLLLFISEISPSDYKGKTWLGLLSLFLYFDFVEQNEDFRGRKY